MTRIKPPTPVTLYISLHTSRVSLKGHAALLIPSFDSHQGSRNTAPSLHLLRALPHPGSCTLLISSLMTLCSAVWPVCVVFKGLLVNITTLSYSHLNRFLM